MYLNRADKPSRNSCNTNENESAKISIDQRELSPVQNIVGKVRNAPLFL